FVVAPLLKGNRAPPWPTKLELADVERVVEERRIIGSEVHVRAAQIIPVRVETQVVRASGASVDKAVMAVRQAINHSLNDIGRGFGGLIEAAAIWSAVASGGSEPPGGAECQEDCGYGYDWCAIDPQIVERGGA